MVGTVICGDSYYGEHLEEAQKACLELIAQAKPDLVIAGPAFNAGRYGVACGDIAAGVTEELGIPAITGMFRREPRSGDVPGEVLHPQGGGQRSRDAQEPAAHGNLRPETSQKKSLSEPQRRRITSPEGSGKTFSTQKNGAVRGIRMLLQKIGGRTLYHGV